MMDKTKIDWADSTWSPITGCLHGCEYCYARGIANRFGGYRDAPGKIVELDEPVIDSLFKDAFAISECSAEGLESPTIIGAQAANELLEIRGMKASVVLTDYNGTIYFSARSIDEVNVQVMMEKLGGGGHRTIAGAQMQGVTVEEAKERLKDVIRQMMEEGEVS